MYEYIVEVALSISDFLAWFIFSMLLVGTRAQAVPSALFFKLLSCANKEAAK